MARAAAARASTRTTTKATARGGAPARGAQASRTAPAGKPAPRAAAPARGKARATTKARPSPRAVKLALPRKLARTDFGKPVDGFFARQPAALRPITDALRALVDRALPHARSSIKWGMPFYELDGAMVCAIGAHRAHVNLILSGPASTFADPDGRLTGQGTTGRHLKLTSLADLPPAAQITAWLRAAAKHAANS